MIQRFMAVKTIKRARISNFINICGIVVMIVVSCYNGLLVYAMYHDCDPLTTNLAKAKDQLLPLMVMENFTDIPGLAGFFVAGVFAAALSTLSTAYNSMAAVAFEDFVKNNTKKPISEAMTFIIMRGTVLILGCLSVAMVYVVQNMGQLLQLTFTIPATSLGPLLGVFTIGLVIPWIGKRATFYSVVTIYCLMLTYVINSQLKVAQGAINYDTRPISTEGCTYNFTMSTTTTLPPDVEIEEPKRTISYLYFTLLGALLVIALASILSLFIFGFQDAKKVNPRVLAPFMRRYIKSEVRGVTWDANGNVVTTHQFEMTTRNEKS
jgi:Na+/proline symporter